MAARLVSRMGADETLTTARGSLNDNIGKHISVLNNNIAVVGKSVNHLQKKISTVDTVHSDISKLNERITNLETLVNSLKPMMQDMHTLLTSIINGVPSEVVGPELDGPVVEEVNEQ